MVGPSSSISKILLGLLLLLIIFYIYLDVHLYLRIQNYPIDRNLNSNQSMLMSTTTQEGGPTANYSDVTWVNCHINPLCDVTVKALMLDHTNHYIFAPLAVLFDDFFSISKSDFITPNMISFSHVLVAIVSGLLVAINSLAYRRK